MDHFCITAVWSVLFLTYLPRMSGFLFYFIYFFVPRNMVMLLPELLIFFSKGNLNCWHLYPFNLLPHKHFTSFLYFFPLEDISYNLCIFHCMPKEHNNNNKNALSTLLPKPVVQRKRLSSLLPPHPSYCRIYFSVPATVYMRFIGSEGCEAGLGRMKRGFRLLFPQSILPC